MRFVIVTETGSKSQNLYIICQFKYKAALITDTIMKFALEHCGRESVEESCSNRLKRLVYMPLDFRSSEYQPNYQRYGLQITDSVPDLEFNTIEDGIESFYLQPLASTPASVSRQMDLYPPPTFDVYGLFAEDKDPLNLFLPIEQSDKYQSSIYHSPVISNCDIPHDDIQSTGRASILVVGAENLNSDTVDELKNELFMALFDARLLYDIDFLCDDGFVEKKILERAATGQPYNMALVNFSGGKNFERLHQFSEYCPTIEMSCGQHANPGHDDFVQLPLQKHEAIRLVNTYCILNKRGNNDFGCSIDDKADDRSQVSTQIMTPIEDSYQKKRETFRNQVKYFGGNEQDIAMPSKYFHLERESFQDESNICFKTNHCKMLLQTSPDYTMPIIIGINEEWTRKFLFTIEEVQGQPLNEVLSGTCTEDSKLEKLLEGIKNNMLTETYVNLYGADKKAQVMYCVLKPLGNIVENNDFNEWPQYFILSCCPPTLVEAMEHPNLISNFMRTGSIKKGPRKKKNIKSIN